MAKVKICGIKNIKDYECATQSGAAWVGMVFHAGSPRNHSFQEANILTLEIANYLRKFSDDVKFEPERVALVANSNDTKLNRIIEAARPALLQCHGNESPERIREIRERFELPVMKAIRVADERSLEKAKAYDDVADRILFDSAPAGAKLPGGTGHSFDWSLMRLWNGKKPWMLAGGLTPDNVSEAISASGAEAVDVSSGVESAPGQKDHDAIRRFVSAAR